MISSSSDTLSPRTSIQNLEEDKGDTERPDKGGAHAEQLHPDDLGGGPADIEQAGGQGAPGAADAVHRNGTDRIVNLDSVKEQNGQDNQNTGDQTDVSSSWSG